MVKEFKEELAEICRLVWEKIKWFAYTVPEDGTLKIETIENPTDEEKTAITTKAVNDLAGRVDRYSHLVPNDDSILRLITSGTVGGIGVATGQEPDGILTIVSVTPGGPADRAGIREGDQVTGIDGQETQGGHFLALNERIRGEAGTTVTLDVIRDGQAMRFEIIREIIEIPSVLTETIGDLRRVRVTGFNDKAVTGFAKAVGEMARNGARGLILDLRGNPGGFMHAAQHILSAWTETRHRRIALTKYRNGDQTEVHSMPAEGLSGRLVGFPTVVLIDEESASAAEITASALRDWGAATLIGVRSFGKGSSQEMFHLGDIGYLKLTTNHWLTSEGAEVNGIGLTPDVTVVMPTIDRLAGVDPQREMAVEMLLEMVVKR